MLQLQDQKQRLAKDWYDQTVLHPFGLASVLILGVMTLLIPRRIAILPIIIMACFVSPAQRIVVSGFDFDLLRIMVLFGWARLFIRNELKDFEWRTVDTFVVAMAISGTILYTLLHQNTSALANRLGWSYELIGMYFLFRFLIRGWKDVETAAACFAIVSIPVAAFFAIEWKTGRNLFGALGGVPEFTHVRDGRRRCQGAFAHPILAGCFWAAVMPLMASLWWRKDLIGRVLAVVGCVMATGIVFTCSSSTPVMAIIFGMIGAAMFLFRKQMHIIFWGGVVLLIGLDLVMNKPVYHLIARITVFNSSTGWHRYNVIHQAVTHFSEWWMMGVQSTLHWNGLYDITNEFVLVAIRGGLLTLIMFLGVMTCSYISVGRLWRYSRPNRHLVIASWALGVSLFIHTMSFISVSYFGQIEVIWHLLIAAIASLAPTKAMLKNRNRQPQHPAQGSRHPQQRQRPIQVGRPTRPAFPRDHQSRNDV